MTNKGELLQGNNVAEAKFILLDMLICYMSRSDVKRQRIPG
jgi:hypothetical protein